MESEELTLDFYTKNSNTFVKDTIYVDMSFAQNKFCSYLNKNDYILDFGCGSGRDTKVFIEKGFNVEAIDGCKELCKIASEYTGINVKNQLFTDLEEIEKYNGIWACSSILHASKEELKTILAKISTSLKDKGILYTSFKYGTFEGIRNNRYFTDFTEESFNDFITNINLFTIKEQWITSDVRPGREKEKWLNIILMKK